MVTSDRPEKSRFNIAVWNTAFLGDAVLTLPLLQTLRRAYPESRLDFYVRSGVAALFQGHPDLDEVFAYDKGGRSRRPGSLLVYGGQLRSRGYDIWVSAHRSIRSAFLARQSGAGIRVGYKSPALNRLFYTRVVDRGFPHLHEVERLLRLAGGLDISECCVWPEIILPTALRDWVGGFWAALGDRPVLGIHPGSVWATKRWPAEYFARLASLALEKGVRIMLFAGPGEEAVSAETLARIQTSFSWKLCKMTIFFPSGAAVPVCAGNRKDAAGADILDLSGGLDLRTLAAFIAALDCYVSNDSGPMHLAWAQKTPLVALFGPTVTGMGFSPRGENSVALELEGLSCRPCGLHGAAVCPLGHHRCMRALSPEQVWNAAHSLMKRLP